MEYQYSTTRREVETLDVDLTIWNKERRLDSLLCDTDSCVGCDCGRSPEIQVLRAAAEGLGTSGRT